uniref:Molybdopterin-binding domain of aldehyde dehydrogenase n=1 Tax=Candidatus Kentrum sp. LFY TaxID=2126342 RepID=A0A450WUY0_9GAMM|nr:MAG: Molybdopterin-binding domain of aldehyde dehydrogenase [Candidatus Kentron sp. LFY]
MADLSPAILDRTLFHSTNSYFVPNVQTTGISCRTNLPPNTAFRGFGTPQAAFVMEAAIFKAASRLGVEPWIIQKKNLLREGDQFHYGMKVENSQARRCWEKIERIYRKEALYRNIRDFNLKNQSRKKGLATIPTCFGVSFDRAIFMNQGYALVHIYNDGSIGMSTGAVEMGQGRQHENPSGSGSHFLDFACPNQNRERRYHPHRQHLPHRFEF